MADDDDRRLKSPKHPSFRTFTSSAPALSPPSLNVFTTSIKQSHIGWIKRGKARKFVCGFDETQNRQFVLEKQKNKICWQMFAMCLVQKYLSIYNTFWRLLCQKYVGKYISNDIFQICLEMFVLSNM